MNWNQIEGDWQNIKGQVREKWSKLTHDDLEAIKGKRDQLLGRLQKRYGVAEEEAERQVDEWANKLKANGAGDHSVLMAEVERLREEVSRLMSAAGDAARAASKDTVKHASAFGKEVEGAVERNPMQALLIAAGVGLVLGWLTRSR